MGGGLLWQVKVVLVDGRGARQHGLEQEIEARGAIGELGSPPTAEDEAGLGSRLEGLAVKQRLAFPRTAAAEARRPEITGSGGRWRKCGDQLSS